MYVFHGRVKKEISYFKFLFLANVDEQTENVKADCNLANSWNQLNNRQQEKDFNRLMEMVSSDAQGIKFFKKEPHETQ